MSTTRMFALATGLALFGMPGAAQAKFIACRLDYQVHAWSIFYKNVTGTGTVKCDNGESAPVDIKLHGGGPTIGVSNLKGSARFSEVRELSEVLGIYGTLEGHAGVVRSAEGRILTKGSVWMSQAGKGRGFDLGVAFGSLSIKKKK